MGLAGEGLGGAGGPNRDTVPAPLSMDACPGGESHGKILWLRAALVKHKLVDQFTSYELIFALAKKHQSEF